jgi:hypothetical protein
MQRKPSEHTYNVIKEQASPEGAAGKVNKISESVAGGTNNKHNAAYAVLTSKTGPHHHG